MFDPSDGFNAEAVRRIGDLAVVRTYPSEMAQNFWLTIFAWTVHDVEKAASNVSMPAGGPGSW